MEEKEEDMVTTRNNAVEERLASIGARIDDALAWLRQVEVSDWRTRIDELRVQAALGEMEARDRLMPLVERLEDLASEIERSFEDVSPSKFTDWSDVGVFVDATLADLREEIESAEREFRIA